MHKHQWCKCNWNESDIIRKKLHQLCFYKAKILQSQQFQYNYDYLANISWIVDSIYITKIEWHKSASFERLTWKIMCNRSALGRPAIYMIDAKTSFSTESVLKVPVRQELVGDGLPGEPSRSVVRHFRVNVMKNHN